MVVLQGSCARANACADTHGRVDLANLRALTLHAVAHLVDLFFEAPLVLLQPRLNHGVRKTHERVAQAHPVLPRSGVSTSTGLLTTQRGERFAVAVSPPIEVQGVWSSRALWGYREPLHSITDRYATCLPAT